MENNIESNLKFLRSCSYSSDYDAHLCNQLRSLQDLIKSSFLKFQETAPYFSTNNPIYEGLLSYLNLLTDEYNYTRRYLKFYRDTHLDAFETYIKGLSDDEQKLRYIDVETPSSDMIDANMGV